MSLQSRIFQGDAKLKAAAVSDPAHITPGAVGDHVVKIQIALMLLDGAWVADHEMRAGIYGRTTAAAVLAHKTKRGIINRNYQSQADDIVGKMTIAAMDRELVARNLRPATIACDYGPQRVGPSRPLFTLASFHPAPAPPVQPPSPIVYVEVAKNTAPEAIDWIRATIRTRRGHRQRSDRAQQRRPAAALQVCPERRCRYREDRQGLLREDDRRPVAGENDLHRGHPRAGRFRLQPDPARRAYLHTRRVSATRQAWKADNPHS